ncbi:MAG: hypothetical protein H0U52_01200 [Chloroflexi bacterium]|nr:hypothetical protein [Chloroflexota bacterium]
MIELIDWLSTEPLPPGTPGWNTLAVKVEGTTRRPGHVFAAVEHLAQDGVCRVLLAVDLPDAGPDVVTPFSLTIRTTVVGVQTFILAGSTMIEEFRVLAPPA